MRRRILIVEDETDLARFMGYRLALADFEPLMANNGKQGLQILNEKEMDLVITDIVMPEMDGLTLCRLMKASSQLSHLPIIIATAYPEREKEFRALGIDEFMNKPVPPGRLIDIIERVLNSRPHKRKNKILLFEKDVPPPIKMAVSQFKDMGFKIDVELIQDHDNLIQDVLRKQPDIFVMDTVQGEMPAPQIIRQLRGFVLLRNMQILVYSTQAEEEQKEKRKSGKTPQDSIIQQCLDAGATKFIGHWDRETFLSILFEYCRT